MLGLYVLLPGVGGVLIGREVILWDLPDVPEPTHLARSGHVNLPAAQNAMICYQAAIRLLSRNEPVERSLGFAAYQPRFGANVDPAILAWATANRPALAVWLDGTARPDALLVQPGELATIPESTLSGLRALGLLGLLEATRRHHGGDLDGAWTYYRAVIRSAYHLGRRGVVPTSVVGGSLLRVTCPRVLSWADESRLPPDQMRRALADLIECRSLASSLAEMICVEHGRSRAILNQSGLRWQGGRTAGGWAEASLIARMEQFWRNEPKRSRKILRLITTGLLAQLDRPGDEQAEFIDPHVAVLALNTSTPPELARIPPNRLAAWVDASGVANLHLDATWYRFLQWYVTTDAWLDPLRLRLAERVFASEHDGKPPRVHGDLIPGYLGALPPGVLAADPIPPQP